ncbi:hypothetical protein ACFX1X_022958 [Malus domestica]
MFTYIVFLIQDSYKNCASALLKETRGVWPDLLVTVLCDEWKRCKRAIEASSLRKEPKCILLSSQRFSSEGRTEDLLWIFELKDFETFKVVLSKLSVNASFFLSDGWYHK